MEAQKKGLSLVLIIVIVSFVLSIIFLWHTPPVPDIEKSAQPSLPSQLLEQTASVATPQPEIVLPETCTSELTAIPAPAVKPTKKRRTRRNRRRKKEAVPLPEQKLSIAAITEIIPITLETPLSISPETKKVEIQELRTLAITNNIPVEALRVNHWTGTYTPTKLEIAINSVPFTIIGADPLTLGATKQVPYTDNCITVHYNYEFLNGMRKGTDSISYKITGEPEQLAMRFSWDTPWHVELDGAERTDPKGLTQ